MESDFTHFDKPEELCNICEIQIPQGFSTAEKKTEYIRQTGSSIRHRVGAVEVECVYGDIPVEKMLHDLISE